MSAAVCAMGALDVIWETASEAAWQRGDVQTGERLFTALGDLSQRIPKAQRYPWKFELARCAYYQGDLLKAQRLVKSASSEVSERATSLRTVAFMAAHDLRQHDTATVELSILDTVAPEVAAGYWGNWWRGRAEYQLAQSAYQRAVTELQDLDPNHRLLPVFQMDLGINQLLMGDPQGVDLFVSRADPMLQRLLGHYRTVMDILLCQERSTHTWASFERAHADTCSSGLYGNLDEIRAALLSNDRQALREISYERAATHEHTRLSLKLVARYRSDLYTNDVPIKAARPSSDIGSLWVAPDGSEVRTSDRVIDFSGRPKLQKMVLALAHGPCSEQSLIRQVWPGEYIQKRAAKNRVHVALSALRKAGLERFVEHVDGGYMLVTTNSNKRLAH